jgi:hypothetical protein
LSESVDPWNHTTRRDNDAALSNPATEWIGQTVNGCKDGIKVLQWLPHPHEDDIR